VDDTVVIFTIGHSTRALADFVSLLQQVDVDLVIDIRSIPHSRANPHFDIGVLPGALAARGIDYRHLPGLGGRRPRPAGPPSSTHSIWREEGFRNYAAYAETDAFRRGIDDLIGLARDHRVAIMCAEAVWWRCHRRIVTDAVLGRGVRVEHLMGAGRVTAAVITPGAMVRADGTLDYRSPR
jgi:uncharacterized protein (DUF488 family)